jgi:hypothetical protein
MGGIVPPRGFVPSCAALWGFSGILMACLGRLSPTLVVVTFHGAVEQHSL